MNKAQLLVEVDRVARDLYKLIATPVVAPAVAENESEEDVCRRLMEHLAAFQARATERERLNHRMQELLTLARKHANAHPDEEYD